MEINKKIIVLLLNMFCSLFPIKKNIIFESNPDLSCNSFEVYLWMLKSEAFSNYSFIWLYKDSNRIKGCKYERTRYISMNPNSVFARLKLYFLCNRAKVVIASCAPFNSKKGNKNQLNIYLDHGSQLKNMKIDGNKVNINCSYIISQGKFFDKYILDQYTVKEEQIINCGIPRNDQFYQDNKDVLSLLRINDGLKVIAWVPTFRIANNGARIDCHFNLPLGLPVIYSEDDSEVLNSYLKERNVVLVVKPHPAQDLSRIKQLNLSNIRFLYNDEMLSAGFHTNQFLSCCDAMITDYSGIYYDFLCLNRPIGITLDDFDAYKIEHGFVFEEPLDVLKGYYIHNLNDMLGFIEEISRGIDSTLHERNRINSMVNDYFDGKSTQRICEFIERKIGL